MTKKTTDWNYDARLTAFAVGELEGKEVEKVEAAMAASPEVRRTVEEILELSSQLQNGFAQEPGLFLTAAQRESVVKGKVVPARGPRRPIPPAADTMRKARVARRRRRVTGWVGGLGAAAAVVVVGVQVLPWGGEGGRTIGAGIADLWDSAREIRIVMAPSPEAGTGDGGDSVAGVLWPEDVADLAPMILPYEIPSFEEVAGRDGGRTDEGGAVGVVAASGEGGALEPGEVAVEGSGRRDLAGDEGSLLWASPRLWAADAEVTRGWRAGGPVSLPERALPADLKLVPRGGAAPEITGGGRLVTGGLEGPFRVPFDEPVSRFPLGGDIAGYANIRNFVTTYNELPPRPLVSLADLVNYFDYGYGTPSGDDPAPARAAIEVVECPWAPDRALVRIGLRAKDLPLSGRGRNVVLLVDASASMGEATKLPVLAAAIDTLVAGLGDKGQIAVVAYGGASYFVLEPTPVRRGDRIRGALRTLAGSAGGDGGRSLAESVQMARRLFGAGGFDQAVVVTDNLGGEATGERGKKRSVAALVGPLQAESDEPVAVFGFGREILGQPELAAGVGRQFAFHHAGSLAEARRVFHDFGRRAEAPVVVRSAVAEVEFNPATVRAYRLLTASDGQAAGPDLLADAASDEPEGAGRFTAPVVEDGGFRPVAVDLVAGQECSAIYEIIPVRARDGETVVLANAPEPASPLRYQQLARELVRDGTNRPADHRGDELLTVRLMHHQTGPGEAEDDRASDDHDTPATAAKGARAGSRAEPQRVAALDVAVANDIKPVAEASGSFRLAAAVTGYGMILREFDHAENLSFDVVLALAEPAVEDDPLGVRAEFLELVRVSRELAGR